MSLSVDNIRGVAFDAVGTLIYPDPPAAEVYATIGRRYGSRLEFEEVRTRFGSSFSEQERLDADNGWATNEDRERRRWQDIVTQVLDDVDDPRACFDDLYAHFAQPAAWRYEFGAAEVLARLRQAGYATAIASNYDRRLRAVAAGLGALSAASTLVISSEVGWRKPSRRFFAQVAEALGLPPSAVLFIGDDLANDIDGAKQAGMTAVLFDPRKRHFVSGIERICSLDELQLGR